MRRAVAAKDSYYRVSNSDEAAELGLPLDTKPGYYSPGEQSVIDGEIIASYTYDNVRLDILDEEASRAYFPAAGECPTTDTYRGVRIYLEPEDEYSCAKYRFELNGMGYTGPDAANDAEDAMCAAYGVIDMLLGAKTLLQKIETLKEKLS